MSTVTHTHTHTHTHYLQVFSNLMIHSYEMSHIRIARAHFFVDLLQGLFDRMKN